MQARLCLLIFTAVVAVASAATADVEGVVVSAAGTAVEHARIETAGGSEVAFSDRRGAFRLPEVVPPVVLVVSHPRFVGRELSLASGEDGPLEIVVDLKQEIYEEIAVSATRGEENFSPVSVATSVVDPLATASPPRDLTELVTAAPAVSENGQGGLFQTYSVRGVSRQRILTLVSGMRIVGERRAGVSASFLDPLLMGSVDILRGPSSTYYGSGALGGVIQVFPRRFAGPSVSAGYGSQGDEGHLAVGWGVGGWSLGLAHRRAGDSETPDGEPLHLGFEQTSATVANAFHLAGLEARVEAIGSLGRDIGKASTDFPERTTTYPRERHLLARFALRGDADWSFDAWVHPNDLETQVVEGQVVSGVANRAFDLGLDWQRHFQPSPRMAGRLGIDYFGRRGVEARETARGTTGSQRAGLPLVEEQTTLDGMEDEAGLFGAVEWSLGKVVLLAGGRLSWQRQQNAGRRATDDSALTGFAGVVAPLGAGFEVVANLGTGLRFPSLSERFFTGTTGRGQVVGNPAIDPERSLNLDAGLRWYGERLFLAGYVFHNRIDDYIERVELAPDLLTYVNLVSGTIRGGEVEGFYQVDRQWSVAFGGHLLTGRSDRDAPLADVPADRLFVAPAWSRGRWTARMRWEHRTSKDDPGPGEKPIPAAELLSLSLGCEVSEGLSLRLGGSNLLDESYFNSADRKVPLSPGRAVYLGLDWQG